MSSVLVAVFLGTVVLGAAEAVPRGDVLPGQPPRMRLDRIGDQLEELRRGFEEELAAEPEVFDLVRAIRDLNAGLVALECALDDLRDQRGDTRDEVLEVLLEATEHRVRVVRARLGDVEDVGAELLALADLERTMRAALAEGRPRRALLVFSRRLPGWIDPLDWPAPTRRRLRRVERVLEAAEVALASGDTG